MDNVLRREQGLPYHYDDPSLQGNQREYQDQMRNITVLMPSDMEKRQAMLKKISRISERALPWKSPSMPTGAAAMCIWEKESISIPT